MKVRLTQNVKDSLLFSLGNYVFQFSSVITNVFINNLLGVNAAGAISYLNAIDRNVDLLYSPIRSALERELPRLRSKNTLEAKIFAESSFLFSYILILFGSIIYLSIYLASHNEYIKYAALFFIFLNIVKALAALIRVYHKSLFNFKYISITLLVVAVLQPIVIIPLVDIYNFNGFFIGRIIIFTVTFLILIQLLVYVPKFNFKIEFNILKQIYIIGLPLVLYSIISVLIVTIDKFFIEKYLSLEELGFYSVGTMIFNILLLLPTSIYGTYYPKFMTQEGDQIKNILIITKIVKTIMVAFIAVSCILIHPMLNLVLPDFIQGTKAAKILFIAFYFSGTYQMYYMDLIRRRKLMKVNLYSGIVVIISIPVFWLATNYGNKIEWVALTTTLIFFLISIVNIGLSQKEMKLSGLFILKTLLLDLVYVIPLTPMFILDFFYDYEYTLSHECAKVGLFIVLFLPFIFNILKDEDMKRVVFSKS